MDSTSPTPPPTSFGALSKTLTKILRLRRTSSISGDAALSKPNPSETQNELSGDHRNETEILIANIFAGVSAVKAAYAQLQLAHSPYDLDLIHFADRAVVTQLKQLYELKQGFLNRAELKQSSSRAEAQLQEQRNLLKTFKIIAATKESELRSKESELGSLQSGLRAAEKQCRALEARLRPGRTLAALDELHLSGLNPTHFLTLLRSAVKSIRSFVKIMVREMKSAGWDLSAAAGVIQPQLLRRRRNTNHNIFAFQSYVSRIMFSDFQSHDFGIGGPARDRRSFFAEFTELKFAKQKECFEGKSLFGKFRRGKYLGLVHPRMEASFFGNLEQRKLVSSGGGSPETDFFEGFAEMARRVWLLHCLFFSFKEEDKGVIFQARKGSRFSEVFMESVAEEEEEEEGGGDRRPAVGFTVLPGFRVGRTVIQCRVYVVYRTGDVAKWTVRMGSTGERGPRGS